MKCLETCIRKRKKEGSFFGDEILFESKYIVMQRR
jgi:hypothetical protein